jgi:hypothetical protein
LDRFAKYNAIANTLRGQICELELVTPLHMPDGSVQEVVNLRRAMCKKASRRRNVTVLEFADVDRSALEQLFPFETFTVADFPELFIDHVGKRVPQGVGTVVKVPTAYIVKSGGTYKYAGPKVLPAGVGAILAVYRGTTAGQGSLVAPAEYALGTVTAPSGLQVHTINFTREQVDFNGRPYVIEADWLLAGSRTPSDEIARILALYGLTVDAATFAAAAAADNAAGFLVDALYGDPGRTGNATIEDLLRVARGWLAQTAAGAWSIVQDVAKASSAQFDTSAKNDLCEVTEYGDGDIPKAVQVQGRPRVSGKDGDYSITLLRNTTTGASGQLQLKFLYVRDSTVLDKLASYWQKRLNTLRVGKATIYAAQVANGSVITITDAVNWVGTKDLIATGISRPADANAIILREYDAAVYVYTAAALPADATNVYSPDYSYTPPLAPTNVAVINQGTSADSDGKVTAFALIRATPPLVNWARLMVQLTDTTTNEIYQAQLLLNPLNGTYEAIVSGLRPNRVHTGLVWAVNANNVDGVTTAIGAFTSRECHDRAGSPDRRRATAAVLRGERRPRSGGRRGGAAEIPPICALREGGRRCLRRGATHARPHDKARGKPRHRVPVEGALGRRERQRERRFRDGFAHPGGRDHRCLGDAHRHQRHVHRERFDQPVQAHGDHLQPVRDGRREQRGVRWRRRGVGLLVRAWHRGWRVRPANSHLGASPRAFLDAMGPLRQEQRPGQHLL